VEIRHWVLFLIIFSVNFFLFICSFWRMHLRMYATFGWIWILNIACFNAWNLFEYELLICFFLKNACKNAWKNLLKFFFDWKCMFECMKFDFLLILNDAFMNAWDFWLNLNFWFEWKCMFECIKFKFLFFFRSAFMNA